MKTINQKGSFLSSFGNTLPSILLSQQFWLKTCKLNFDNKTKQQTTMQKMYNNSNAGKLVMAFILSVIFAFSSFQSAQAQSSANYAFTTNTSGSLALDANGNSVDMTTGTTQLVAALQDGTASAVTNIGFSYVFMGKSYTQFSANADGFVALGSTVVSGATMPGSTTTPKIAAMGGDLYVSSTGKVHYKIVGTAPNRCLVVEFLNMAVFYSTTASDGQNTYQVRLYETTGVTEFVYGTMYCGSTTYAPGYVGFSTGSTLNLQKSITTSTNSESNSATFNTNSYTAATNIANLHSTIDGSRRVYKFTPPATSPADPTSLSYTTIAATTTTPNLVDNSINEVGFLVTRATDVAFTQNVITTTVVSTTSAGTGTTYTSPQTGLTPGITYYYKIQALTEAVLSTGVTGSQTTSAAATYYYVGASPGDIATAANWNTNPAGGGTTRATPLTTDILVVDGAGTTAGGSVTLTMAAAASIGALQVTSNTAVTLQSTTTTQRVLTLTGSVGDELSVGSGSSLLLTNATNPSAVIFSTGTGMTGTIAGTLTVHGTSSNSTLANYINTTGGTSTVVTVTGTINNTATTNITTSGNVQGSAATLIFAAGSAYNVSGATTGAPWIPLATWNATSTLTVSGLTTSTTAPTNAAQSFGNFTYNCPAQTGTMSWFGTSTTSAIKGDLYVQATGTGRLRLLTSGTLPITGNVTIAGTASTATCEIASTSGIVTVSGSVNLASNGTLDLTSGTSTATLKALGGFNQTAGTLNQTGTFTPSNIEFNGTSAQNVTIGTMGTGPVNFKINNAAGINLTGTMNINNTAGLTITNGNITGSGTVAYNATASKLTYNSTTGVQTANAIEFPSTGGPVTLVINNTATSPNNTVTFSAARSVGALTLTAGIYVNGSNTITVTGTTTGSITGGSTTAYVKGAIARTLPASLVSGSTYNFPVGKSLYRNLDLLTPIPNPMGP